MIFWQGQFYTSQKARNSRLPLSTMESLPGIEYAINSIPNTRGSLTLCYATSCHYRWTLPVTSMSYNRVTSKPCVEIIGHWPIIHIQSTGSLTPPSPSSSVSIAAIFAFIRVESWSTDTIGSLSASWLTVSTGGTTGLDCSTCIGWAA